MNTYSTEAEQIEAIKKWWEKYGNTLLTVVLLFILVIVGFRWWQQRNVDIRAQASIAYEQLLESVAQADSTGIEAHSNHLIKEYGQTVYAANAALFAAKLAVEKDDFDQALRQLDWVIAHANTSAIKQSARLRAARILLLQGKTDLAMEKLAQVDDSAFQPTIDEVKGDIYVAMKQFPAARDNYQQALDGMSAAGFANPMLQLKLSTLPAKNTELPSQSNT